MAPPVVPSPLAAANLLSPRPPMASPQVTLDSHAENAAVPQQKLLTIVDEVHKPLSSAASVSSELVGKDFLTAMHLNRLQLNYILNLASDYKAAVHSGKVLTDVLPGMQVGTIFYEESTRTYLSFVAAAQRLGANVLPLQPQYSSISKGESLEDTVRTMANYSDAVVIRHPEPGAVDRAVAAIQPVGGKRSPVINAGDGIGEHPTQALLDVFAIREELGTVTGKVITMVGDLKHGRTVHSLAKLLTLFDVTLRYVAIPGLEMPDSVVSYVAKKGILQQTRKSLEEAIVDTDVLYMTRVQKKRFATEEVSVTCY